MAVILLLNGCTSSSGDRLSREYTRIEKRAADTDRMMSQFTNITNTLDDGSEMISYYHNGILKKIHINKDLTGGLETRDLYFHNWRISYIVDSMTDLDMGPGNSTVRDIYYFKDDALIGWKRPDNTDIIYTSGSGYKEKETELLRDVDKYLLVIQ